MTMRVRDAHALMPFTLPGSRERQLLEELANRRGKAQWDSDGLTVTLNGVQYAGGEARLVATLCEEGCSAMSALELLMAVLPRLNDSSPTFLRVLSRLKGFGGEEWGAMAVVLRALVMTNMPTFNAMWTLGIAELLLKDRENCSCLRLLLAEYDCEVIWVLAQTIPVHKRNCDVVFERALNGMNYLTTVKRRAAIHAAALFSESSYLWSALQSLNCLDMQCVRNVMLQSPHVRPGNVMATERVYEGDGGVTVDEEELCRDHLYVSQCTLMAIDPNHVRALWKAVRTASCRTVHPVVVLALLQHSPVYEAKIRKRSDLVAQKLVLSIKCPQLTAWLLARFFPDYRVHVCVSQNCMAALYSWHLIDKPRDTVLIAGVNALLWRRHTHRFFSPKKRKRVVWLLCLVNRVFPEANHDIRCVLIEMCMAKHWYDASLSTAPKVELRAPWKVLQKENEVGEEKVFAYPVQSQRVSFGTRKALALMAAGAGLAAVGFLLGKRYLKGDESAQ